MRAVGGLTCARHRCSGPLLTGHFENKKGRLANILPGTRLAQPNISEPPKVDGFRPQFGSTPIEISGQDWPELGSIWPAFDQR